MPLREFSDPDGRPWRVWNVSAEALHPSTRAEDYLRDYLGGWLAFESLDGEAKCRLTPIPHEWEKAPVEQLLLWLRAAEPVRGDRTSGPQRVQPAEEPAAAASERELAPGRPKTRTFRFPGGRYWTVAEWFSPDPQGSGAGAMRRVLRFASGTRSLEMTDWPRDWAGMSDDDLAELLARSFPREPVDAPGDGPARRASDPRS